MIILIAAPHLILPLKNADDKLIWDRFVASQMPDAEYLSTSAKINVNENIFVARGRELVFDGFTKVQKTSTKDEEMLPTLNEGEIK